MKDKFSLYQADGFWGIIEDASDENQTSLKSYIGPDLIVKRLNEQSNQIDQLKQQLAEKDCRIEELEGQFAYECECNKQLVELQKQLDEKQKTIDEINKEFVQAVHDWKTLCAEKDEEINSLIADYEKRISQEQELMSNMEHQLAEKDKEVEKLKQQYTILENENGKLTTELIMDKYKKAQKEVSFGKQLAIRELEKLKTSAGKWFEFWENSKYEGNIYDKLDVSNAYLQMSCEINQQIKQLKGEKDVED